VTTESPTSNGPVSTAKRKPWYLSPWLWAGLGGILFVTFGRDCTRRIPDPPPVLGSAPSFALTELNGTPLTHDSLAGQPYLAHVVGPDCGDACDIAMVGMMKLHQGFEEGVLGKVPVRQITFVAGDDGLVKHYNDLAADNSVDRTRWYFVRGPNAIIAEIAASFASMGEKPAEPVWAMGLALVDGQGRCRGLYGTDSMELNRAFFQAEQVSRESK